MPPLYSGSFGLGSRDLQPEGLIGAVENMIPSGTKRKFFYLSIDFVRDKPFTPKQEIHQIQVADGYPGLKALAVHGSENPNLMPKNSITRSARQTAWRIRYFAQIVRQSRECRLAVPKVKRR